VTNFEDVVPLPISMKLGRNYCYMKHNRIKGYHDTYCVHFTLFYSFEIHPTVRVL